MLTRIFYPHLTATLCWALCACSSSPASVAEKLQSAITRNHLEDAVDCFADNATVTFTQGASVQSKAAIRTALARKFASGYRVERATSPVVKGHTAVWTVTAHDAVSMQLGLAALDRTVEAVIKKGKVVSLKALWTPESLATLSEAQRAQAHRVFHGWLQALNNGNSQGVMAKYAPKATWVWAFTPPERYETPARIASHMHMLVEQGFKITPLADFSLKEHTLSVPCSFIRNDWKEAGIAEGKGALALTLADESVLSVLIELDAETRTLLTPAQDTPPEPNNAVQQ